MHWSVGSGHADPSLGMSEGQPAVGEGPSQYHAGGVGMHTPPKGGHSAHVQISPDGYPQTESPASPSHDDWAAGGVAGQPGDDVGHDSVPGTQNPPWQVTWRRQSAKTESP